MKRKFSKILGMGLALALVLSLVVMAVPVLASATTMTLTPATTKGNTSTVFSLKVENTGAVPIDTVTLDVPPPGSGGSNHIVTELLNGPSPWVANASLDGNLNVDVITWTGGTIAASGDVTFTFTATTPSLGETYSWNWTTTDTGFAEETGTVITTADNLSPTLTSIVWTDVGTPGSTDINVGDTLLFTFSENMDTTIITAETIDTVLPPSGGGSYGTTPTVDWATPEGDNTLTVTLGTDPTIVSGDTVDPTDAVTDAAGNADATVTPPEIVDDAGPTLDTIVWTDEDGSTDINVGDTLLFTFSEAMDTSTVTDSSLSTRLPLLAGSYGTATIDWATPAGDDTLTVTLGTGVVIADETTVNPDAAVKDAAGNEDNTVTPPAIDENVKPILLSIIWDDVDSSVTVNVGDTLVFTFSEAMDTETITAGNIGTDLPPSAGGYGAVTAGDLSWNTPDNTILAVTLGTGTTIATMATVDPADTVTDVAGNIDNTTTPPAIVQVTVSIDAPATVAPGATFTATVDITNVADLDAASYNVMFDSAVLELTSITAGTVGTTTIPVSATADILGGDPLVVVGVTVVQNVGGTEGVSGSGTLAVLNFTFIGNSGDTSTLSFAVNILGDNQANEIYANWFGASVAATALVGDANGDGSLNALDITKIELDVAAGLTAAEAAPGADANEDGNIDALDITKVEILVGEA